MARNRVVERQDCAKRNTFGVSCTYATHGGGRCRVDVSVVLAVDILGQAIVTESVNN